MGGQRAWGDIRDGSNFVDPVPPSRWAGDGTRVTGEESVAAPSKRSSHGTAETSTRPLGRPSCSPCILRRIRLDKNSRHLPILALLRPREYVLSTIGSLHVPTCPPHSAYFRTLILRDTTYIRACIVHLSKDGSPQV